MRIDVELIPNPLHLGGRSRKWQRIEHDTTLAEVVRERCYVPGFGDQLAACLDNDFIPQSAWDETPVSGCKCVVIRAVVGDDDSDPLHAILSIGLSFLAPYLGAKLAGALSIPTWAGTGIVFLGGGLIINELVPPPELPDRPDPQPVYSLSGGSNRARPYGPVLLVLGTHRVFPDLAAREYVEFRDDDQYLAALFDFGFGDLDISDLKLGNTQLDNFEELTTESLAPGQNSTIIAGNVDTITGAELTDTDWVLRTSSRDADKLQLDFTGRILRIESDGAYTTQAVSIQISYRENGTTDAWTTIDRTFMNNSQSPFRSTIEVAPPAFGKTWDVRVKRTGNPSDNDRIYDDLAWSLLRTYQPDDSDASGRNRLAVEVRASGQISGRLDRLSALVKQKVPTWDGSSWSAANQASSNPADILLWFARGIRVSSNLLAGAGLPDSRIDFDSIQQWREWCETNELACNTVIDSPSSVHDVLDIITRCGRASTSWQSGKLGVIYDEPNKTPSAYISAGNVIAGSMSVDYAAGKTADEIVCKYIDPDFDWQVNEVRRTRPGATAVSRTANVTLGGVTSASQAAKECNLLTARQIYHKRRLSWEMTLEGMALSRGDVAYMSHSLVSGGITGRCTGGTKSALNLGREIQWGSDDYILIRLPDGALHNSSVSNAPGTVSNTAMLASDLPINDEDLLDGGAGDFLWRHYAADQPPLKVKIVAIEPTSPHTVRVSAIDEVREYYAAGVSDLTIDFPATRVRPPKILSIRISEQNIRAGGGYVIQITAALVVDGDWRGGELIVSGRGIVAQLTGASRNASWLETSSGNIEIIAVPGSFAAPAGGPLKISYKIEGPSAKPATPINFLIDVYGDGTRRFRWQTSNTEDVAGYRIRYAEMTSNQILAELDDFHSGLITQSPYESNLPGVGDWSFALTSVSTFGVESDPIWISADLPSPRAGGLVYWNCPSAQGWPGSIVGAVRSNDGMDALEAKGDYDWDDMDSWSEWTSWSRGNGENAVTELSYTSQTITLPREVSFKINWSADTTGTVAIEYQLDDDVDTTSWTAYSDTLLTATTIKIRWKLTGDGSTVLRIDHLCVELVGNSIMEQINDADTANWNGTASGGRIVPLERLDIITSVLVTLQSVGSGWTWELINKTDPKIKIYDSAGNAADATIDVVAYGIAN